MKIAGKTYAPTKEIPREAGRIVLAHGEVTGHAHAIASPDAKFFEASDEAALALGTRILRTQAEVALTHEEHGTIPIPQGEWGVRIQRQYELGASRRVED